MKPAGTAFVIAVCIFALVGNTLGGTSVANYESNRVRRDSTDPVVRIGLHCVLNNLALNSITGRQGCAQTINNPSGSSSSLTSSSLGGLDPATLAMLLAALNNGGNGASSPVYSYPVPYAYPSSYGGGSYYGR